RPMTGQIVLLTGATGTIGRELSRSLIARGHTVLAVSRRAEMLEALAADTRTLPGKLVPLAVDLVSADLQALVADLDQRGLSPNHLINNARDLANLRLREGQTMRAQWSAEYALGVAVPAELTLALSASPRAALESVVNVSSMYGMVAVNPALY